ncbi:MAG: hypothetical protein K2M47_05515 [Clostridiales bacterium]|nr:hypothetical protein [Clostridiales bacterium]
MLAAVITALAVAITCALCIGYTPTRTATDSAEQGEVKTSTAYTPTSGTTYTATSIAAGDTLTYSYTGSVYSVTLPIGTYYLEVWGAQGGYGYSSSILGGYGGYAKATYTITTATTLYICVGGAGATATSTQGTTTAGGYNGGGSTTYNRTCGHRTASGGGATHIATATGKLSALSSNTGAVLIVGGGGGGGGYSNASAVGGNGGPTGGTAIYNSSYTNTATGGSTSGGGTSSVGSTPYSSLTTAGGSGSFGQGGNGASVSSGCGGAGGGGGYYGGAGGSSGATCYGCPGGGGCNYIKSTLTTISNTTQTSVTGNGKAVITVVSVNRVPTTRSASVTVQSRGSTSTTAIAASTLATDPEGTAVYYTNNTSSNYDTSPTANTGLWLSTGSYATNYFDWTWSATSSATTLTITNVKRYPRSGTDGSTADGKLTLYVYIRDAFGSTTTRGVSKITFTVTVTVDTVSLRTGVVSGQSNVGASTIASTSPPVDPASASGIFNPNGTGRSTLFIKKSLTIGEAYTPITAASLLSGLSISGNYDQAVISINSTTAITGSARKYKIQEVDNNTSKVTAYLANKTVIANAYSQLTLECITPDPNYQVLPITIYTVEKTTAFGSSYPNVVPGISAISLEIVFKMGNIRPVLKSAASSAINVTVGASQSLSLNTYFSDADTATISSSTHTITGVSVPANEFVLIDRQQKVVAATGYNIGYTTGATVSGDPFTTTATGTTTTGFNANIAYNATSPVSGTIREQAFMSFTYANDVLTVTGLRASYSQYSQSRTGAIGHFYLLLHISDKRETADNGIWLPLAFTVGNSNTTSHTPVATVTSPSSVTSQTAVSTFPTADGAVGDSFYFAPMAINYSGSHVVGQYKAEDANGENTGALTSTGLQPLAIDGDNFSTANGLATWGNGKKLNELLRLTTTPEQIVKSVSEVGVTNSNGVWENYYIKAQTIPIYISRSYFATAAYGGGRVVVGSGTNGNGYYFVNLPVASDNTAYYTIDGLKITLKSATMNRYVYATAGVNDVTSNAVSTINIAIRVKNTPLQTYKDDSGKIATFGNPERDSAYSTYSYAANGDTPTFTYKIPLGGTVMVTPYDLAYDYNMGVVGVNEVTGGFTLNGYSGRYNSSTGLFTTGSNAAADGNKQFTGMFASSYNAAASTFLSSTNKTTLVKKVSNTASGTASNTATTANANMVIDKLYFERTTGGSDAYTYNPTTFNNVSASKANTANFVDVDFGTNVKIGGTTYAVDFMMLTALNRTTQPAVVDLVVRDRYGSNSSDGSSSFTVRIVIEVVNTKPNIKNPAYYKELSVKPIVSGQTVVTPDIAVLYANGNGSETGLMEDHDRDVPEYMMASGIAVVNKSFVDGYNTNNLTTADGTAIDILTFDSFDGLADKYTANGTLSLTNYVTAEILSRRELSVSAVSSTKAIVGGVYVAFFVTDNSGGTSLGYVQIEVINTVPVLNESETNGFDAQNPMWNIESTSDGDIMRSRYIVGSQTAADSLKTAKGALDIDIKLIAVDEDGLHNKVVLSQCTNITNESGNAVFSYINKTADAFDAAVPSIGFDASTFNGTPSAVKVFTRTGTTTAGGVPTGYTAELNFLVNNTWYTRTQLVNALSGGTISSDTCFDNSGRFIIADWALLLHAQFGFESNEDVGVRFSLRDQAELGGDTAGAATAFNSNRSAGNVVVNGRLLITVYQHISKTGIRSINEYLGQNNDYYTVEYTTAGTTPTTTRYISTYDGNTDDGSLANKATSGAVYTATSGDVAGAFKYSDTIEVPSAIATGHTASGENVTYQSVYVPMSYFGLLSTLVGAKTSNPDMGKVEYPTDTYVGYELPKNSNGTYSAVDLNNINQILACMTLSDGTYEWKGTDINNNPYITIGAFDWYHDSDDSTNSARLATDPYSSAYYNNRLAVVTRTPEDTSIGYEQYEPNVNNIVGEDEMIMYLEEQATKLIEHNFGLTFTKKNVRTSTRSLSFTINLARYKGTSVALTNGEISNVDRRTVELKIHVENSKLDLYSHGDESNAAQSMTDKVKYDTVKGTYYTDLELKSSESAAYTLSRKAVGQNPSTAEHVIEYYDDDYGTADKRDYAYFSSDSFMQLSQWQVGAEGYNRAMKLTDNDSAFANVLATSDKAQKSVENYFGVNDYDSKSAFIAALNDSDKAYKNGTYQANAGMYGVAGKDGYSSYFNASLTNNNTTLNIMPVRKTFINETAFGNDNVPDLKTVDTTSQESVAEAYARRGLVALYDSTSVDPLTPSRVYYPFKVLIYDSFGLGFNDASYVAIELRITIINGDPSLKLVGEANGEGRQYSMNLAVGNSATINLYDIVSDPDIYTYTQNNVGRLSTKAYFETNSTGIVCETGDYLDSPLERDEYKTVQYHPDVQKEGEVYYYNGGGFVSVDSDAYSERDVVMYMNVTGSGAPQYNTIMFRVNRRTTATYNNRSVSVDRYKFTLRFYDGTGAYTAPFTFIINITNQTPSVTQVNRSFTMRAGDDITILTSYYDVFSGANDSRIATAYRYSDTYTMITERQASAGYGTTFGDGSNNATGNGEFWKFADITTATAGGTHITYDSTLDRGSDGSTVHLGYVGLATDDTPWRLRFTEWTQSNDRINVYSEGMLALRPEGSAANASAQTMALRIIARSACINEPFTVTIADGEGGIITCTLYITIVSSPPIALDCSDDDENVKITDIGLEGVYNANGSVNTGTFATYIVPAEGTHTFNVAGVGQRTARRVTTVRMNGVARDPDGDSETRNMRLYGNGEFVVNEQPLVSDVDGVYRTEYFEIKPSTDGLSFTITATGYNPDTTRGYEELQFRIADYGDSAYDNTLLITIRIYTLYSDMTNPTAATATGNAYTNYLKGSDTINVKSYDVFYNPAQPTDSSKYAFVNMTGNVGNDNNNLSPIVDPDATVSGDANYDVRMYAFIDVQDDGSVIALSSDAIRAMLDQNGTRKTFRLKTDGDYSDYMIGGRLADGTTVPVGNVGNVKLNAILNYASFEFAADGASVLFTPKASTLNSSEFILYVEVTKPIGDRAFSRTDAVLSAGSLFKLNVIDSAPQAVDGRHEVEGVKGTVGTFTVFNPEDRYGALFMDSDAGDNVTVHGIVNNRLTDAEYENVMSEAIRTMPGLEWRADTATGRPRAFDISINNNGEMEVKINRRIDYVVGGVYQPSVTIPLIITGEDSVGERVTTTVYVTIHNSDLGAVESYTEINAQTQVGYTFVHDDNDEYVMNVQLRFDTALEVNLADILTDNDTATYDADSYRFVLPKSQGGYTYITDKKENVDWYELDSNGNPNIDNTKTLATAEPVGDDDLHITGILFNAVATERDLTGTVYVRIIDRSADVDVDTNGIIIKINVIVMNDAPYTLDGKENTTLYMIGSENGEPAGMLFFIGDFVADKNDSDVVGDDESALNPDTCLRIVRQDARAATNVYSQKYTTIPDSFGITDIVMSTALFEVTIPARLDDTLLRDYCKRMGKEYGFKDNTNLYNQWFVVKPREGFYGSGAVDITIVDGNANVKDDTLSTTFCLEVHVISNPNEVIDGLTDVELACSKTKQLDIRSLMPDLPNNLALDENYTNFDGSDQASVFSQYEYYEIVSIGFQNEIDKSKADFNKLDESGQLWEIKAGNQVTRDPVRVEVNFALKSDKSVTYKKYFYLNIVANRSPQIKFTEIVFKRHGDDGNVDELRDLDEANTIRLQAWQLFEDADDPEGTAIRFVDVKSQVSSLVKAKLVKDENGEYKYLEISFVARGESEITVTVTDETGSPVQLKFIASNKDLPEASLWVKLAASFESNMVMWIIIICCALLLLVVLIIIIAVIRKRKREREEIEALLVSEMEIEEQMLKLAGGPSPTDYQSFGYLPGGPAPQADPSMMLGAGTDAPQQQLTALPPAQDPIDGNGGSDAAM